MSHLKQIILISFFCINSSINANASKQVLNSAVFNETDVTSVVLSAINGTKDTVEIENTGKPWIVEPMVVTRDNFTLLLHEGVVLQAKIGSYTSSSDCLLNLRDRKNITITGYGAGITMQKNDAGSEWNHCIRLRSCSNINIYGLYLKDAGGDGLAIEGFGLTTPYSSNIHVMNCIFDNNGRNNLSVINAENVLIEFCKFLNASGNPPQNGIDIEPDVASNRIVNIKIQNCYFENNSQAGVAAYLNVLDGTSPVVSITVENCYFNNTGKGGRQFSFTADRYKTMKGFMEVKNCFFENDPFMAIEISKQADMSDFDLSFSNCVISNAAHTRKYYDAPIIFWASNVGNQPYGGVAFNNCLIFDNIQRPAIKTLDEPTNSLGCKNISGNISVVNTLDCLPDFGSKSQNISLVSTQIKNFIKPDVTLKIIQSSTIEGNTSLPLQFSFLRSGGKTDVPCAVRYQINGTSTIGNDYHLSPGFVVLNPNELSKTETIFARYDGKDEDNEIVEIKTSTRNNIYNIKNSETFQMFISDKEVINYLVENTTNNIEIYPNPASSQIQVSGIDIENTSYSITGIEGKIHQTGIMRSGSINIENLKSGIYFIKIKTDAGESVQRFIKD